MRIYNNIVYWTELRQYFQWLVDKDIPLTISNIIISIDSYLYYVREKYKPTSFRSKKSRLHKSIIIYNHLLNGTNSK